MTHPMARAHERWRAQRSQSINKRNIPFNLTFDEWYNWWLAQGVDKNIDMTPFTKTKLCMCRYNDTGPYEIGNIYCATASENSKSAMPKSGKLNGHARAVYTPKGKFDTVKEAADAYGITSMAIIQKLVNKNKPDYYYLTGEQP